MGVRAEGSETKYRIQGHPLYHAGVTGAPSSVTAMLGSVCGLRSRQCACLADSIILGAGMLWEDRQSPVGVIPGWRESLDSRILAQCCS